MAPRFDAGTDAAALLLSSVDMTEVPPMRPDHDRLATLMRWLGADSRSGAAKERAIATLGSLLAMAAVFTVSHAMPGGDHLLIVASSGASAILIFAVPHGRLSQPWPVLMGHILCAVIGVSCAKWIGTGPLSATLTVSLCILAMSLARCIHPPAGATALTAVLGGAAITDLGYSFVAVPVAVNMLTLIGAAFLINLPFRGRRYPAAFQWQRRTPLPPNVARSDLRFALSEMNTFMDISEDDLMRIYELARRHADGSGGITPNEIQAGRFFSNGEFGNAWEVREILSTAGHDPVRYRIVAGPLTGETGETALGQFVEWTAYPVAKDADSWKRMTPGY